MGVGFSSGATELLTQVTLSTTAGQIYGNLTAHLGSDADNGGAYYYETSKDVHLTEVVTVGAVTAGAGSYRFVGEVLS